VARAGKELYDSGFKRAHRTENLPRYLSQQLSKPTGIYTEKNQKKKKCDKARTTGFE
jgi:hypothetical protein